jgi:type I restriction enzyme M protein
LVGGSRWLIRLEAVLIRDTLKRRKYQAVILPLTVLRRVDWMVADTKDAVLKCQPRLEGNGP